MKRNIKSNQGEIKEKELLYENLTNEIKRMNANIESCDRYLNYAMDKNKNVYYSKYFESKDDLVEERKYRYLIERKTGYKTYLNPKTYTTNVKTPDFWIEDINELWDIKGINGNGKNTIDNIIHKAESQTNNLILKQRNTEIDISIIKDIITKIFEEVKRKEIKQIILLDINDNIILYYKR